MPAGRKPLGIREQVDRLPGSPVAKERLRVVLANLAGEMSTKDACAALEIEESWFFELKHRSLERWMEAMEPETPGRRPAPAPTAEQPTIAELEERNRHLELELEAARLRAELARAGMTRSSKSTERAAKKARR
jgi:hypothetical protein